MTARTAVGFVETRGLVGVIEAADSAVKAADVRIIGFEPIGDGLVSVCFQGDVASVQAAVQTAVESAGRVSTVVSHHVIPAPHGDLGALLPSSPEWALPVPVVPAAPAEDRPGLDDLDGLPVVRLRQLVRQTPGALLRGREVSHANKARLIQELRRLLNPET
jgi:bacterial microcompartment shell protein